MRATTIAAALALLALPGAAQAAKVTGEAVSVPLADTSVGCVDRPARIFCEIYSGAKATLTGIATTDDSLPLPNGTVLRLTAANPVTGSGGAVSSRTLDGGAANWSFQQPVKVGTLFRVDVLEGGTVTGSGRPLLVLAKARVIDTSASSQRGTRFVLKGKVAMAPSFGGGTLTVQRCKRRSAARCRIAKNGDWRPAVLTKRLTKAGAFRVSLVRPGSGLWSFRVRFNAKLARNADTLFGYSISWS